MIEVTSHHLKQISLHAQMVYPEECCGLLLGLIKETSTCLVEVRETENSWKLQDEQLFQDLGKNQFSELDYVISGCETEQENSFLGSLCVSPIFLNLVDSTEKNISKYNRFAIAPEIILRVQKECRDRNLDIIGVYHSHPDYPAIPSEFDRAIAWPQYSYIIISLQQGKITDIRSWKLDENSQFQEEMIKNIA